MPSIADVPAVRILPMSDKIEGFADKSIEQVQTQFFLKRLPARRGRFGYLSTGLNADRGTIVLFQFKARAIASATFLRDEKFEKPEDGLAGELQFDPASIHVFDPWDAMALRQVWSAFKAFGHAKFRLNPGNYPAFVRKLRNVRAPTSRWTLAT